MWLQPNWCFEFPCSLVCVFPGFSFEATRENLVRDRDGDFRSWVLRWISLWGDWDQLLNTRGSARKHTLLDREQVVGAKHGGRHWVWGCRESWSVATYIPPLHHPDGLLLAMEQLLDGFLLTTVHTLKI